MQQNGANGELPLQGIRIADLTWLISGGWGTRQLASLGAEVVRIEWESNIDAIRHRNNLPSPGDAAREAQPSINRGGSFNNTNAGKLSFSLNIKHPKGKEAFRRLIAVSDVVIENFTAGVLPSWGFTYEAMREIKPDIIYVQLPGYGSYGPYSEYRAYGLINQAFSGLSYQVGVPEPAQPSGWGYGYMDAMVGVYNSMAVMSALHHRSKTGKGQYIDMAQTEMGIYITGPAYLDKQANGRDYQRSGNRSPYLPAAPHGVYRCVGEDEWLAIACFSEEDWQALRKAIGEPAWASDPKFATLEARLANHAELDQLVEGWTRLHGKHMIFHLLQRAGVPTGPVQTSQEVMEYDPSLLVRDYVRWLPQTEAGLWPLEGPAGIMSETPSRPGGILNRASPNYGEDTDYVLRDVLGYSPEEIAGLREEHAV